MTRAARPGPVVVGPLERRHLRTVMRIDSLVYPTTWSRNLWLHELSLDSSRHYVGASRGGRLVGHGGAMFAGDDTHITTVAVDPTEQRTGIGTHLVLALARAAVRAGSTGLTLEVRHTNDAAQRLYRKFGLAPAGIRRGYYDDPGGRTDALIMWVHDIDLAPFAARLDRIEAELAEPAATENLEVSNR